MTTKNPNNEQPATTPITGAEIGKAITAEYQYQAEPTAGLSTLHLSHPEKQTQPSNFLADIVWH
jgi:hypothetical protein